MNEDALITVHKNQSVKVWVDQMDLLDQMHSKNEKSF